MQNNPFPVLRTLYSLFTFFALFHARHHKMQTFRNYIYDENNRHCGCEAIEASHLVLSRIT